MTTFNERVARHIQAYQDKHGLTNLQVANLLGLAKANYISMLKNHPGAQSPMALKLLRRMCIAFCLTPRECARLVLARVVCHPDGATALDLEVLRWVYKMLSLARTGGHGAVAT